MNLPHAKRYAKLGYPIRQAGSDTWFWLHSCVGWVKVTADKVEPVRAGDITMEMLLADNWTLDGEARLNAENELPPCGRPSLPDPGPLCVGDPSMIWFDVNDPGCEPIRARFHGPHPISELADVPLPPEEPADEFGSGMGSGGMSGNFN